MSLKPHRRALVIVAHPDDETIWMGTTIRRYPELAWTIFSLCRASDADRAPKFRRVCEYYGAECLIADLDDADILDDESAQAEAKSLIKENISADDFAYIFTHGKNGEYGHPRHVAVHNAVCELMREGRLRPETLFCFAYRRSSDNKSLVPDAKSIRCKLTPDELNEKKRIVAEMFGYPREGIDVGYCTSIEAFEIL